MSSSPSASLPRVPSRLHLYGSLPSEVHSLRIILSTRFFVSFSTFCALITRRDVEVFGFILGALVNAVLSKVLKRLLKQKRPEQAAAKGLHDAGMPSSHSMTLFFYASFLGLAIVLWPGSAWLPAPLWQRVYLYGFVWFFATASSALRVFAGLHTAAQVLVGAGFGTVSGAAWLVYGMPVLRQLRDRHDLPYGTELALVVLVVLASALVIERSLQKQVKKKVKKKFS